MGRHPSRRHVSPEDAPVGGRIRQRRRDLGFTQADLAGSDYTKSFISQIEGGHADPSLDTLRLLGRRLRWGLSTLAGDATDQRLAVLSGLVAWAETKAAAADPEAARRAATLAREMACEWREPLFEAEALLLLARVATLARAFDAAQDALDAVAALSLAPGSRIAVRAALASGDLALLKGDTTASLEAYRRAAGAGLRTARHPDLRAHALLGIAAAADRNGNRKQARRRLQSALTLAARHRLHGTGVLVKIRLAALDRFEGRDAAARQHLQDAERMLPAAPRERLVALVALVQEALVSHDLALAERAGQDAGRVADTVDDAVLRARAGAVIGRVLAACGRREDGAARLSEAVARLAGGCPPAEVVEAAREFGEFYQAAGDRETAARFLAVAAGGALQAPEVR